tara:strand:- start:297 stop:515 length:219 start_codon:yes stop_codon:yes gene_type:complete
VEKEFTKILNLDKYKARIFNQLEMILQNHLFQGKQRYELIKCLTEIKAGEKNIDEIKADLNRLERRQIGVCE